MSDPCPPSSASRLVQTRKAGVFWERSRPRRCSSRNWQVTLVHSFTSFPAWSWKNLVVKVYSPICDHSLEMKEKLRTGHKAIKSIDKVFNEFPGGQNTQINTIIGLQLSYVFELIFIPLNHLQLSTNKCKLCLKAVHIYNIPTNGAIIMKIERDSHWIVINTLVVFISSKQYPSAFADIFDEETWYQFFFVFTCCTFVCVFILSRLHNFGIRHFIWVSSAQRQFYWIFCLWIYQASLINLHRS